jgi:hypothetical protein
VERRRGVVGRPSAPSLGRELSGGYKSQNRQRVTNFYRLPKLCALSKHLHVTGPSYSYSPKYSDPDDIRFGHIT